MTENLTEDKKVEYNQVIEHVGRYKVIHNIPIMTTEEREEKKKEILLKMYNILSNIRIN